MEDLRVLDLVTTSENKLTNYHKQPTNDCRPPPIITILRHFRRQNRRLSVQRTFSKQLPRILIHLFCVKKYTICPFNRPVFVKKKKKKKNEK